MECNRAIERFLDALTGAGDEEPGEDVRAHIAECRACGPQAARYRALWEDLGRLEVPGQESADSEGRLARRLNDAFWARARAELASSSPGPKRALGAPAPRSLLAAAALVGLLLGGLGGYLLAPGGDGPGSQAAVSNGRQSFLLLLRESPEVQARFELLSMDSVVAEYRAWANQLAARGRLSGAAKLEDEARFVDRRQGELAVERRDVEELGSIVTGYFLIRATDYQEALEVTADSPHLRYGGVIELRAIEQGS